MHPRYLTPTVSTIAMGAVSIVVYVAFNYMSNGIGIIGDAVIAIGLYIAFYYGLTGFACAWYYRRNLTSSARNLWMQGILPVAGGLILFFLGGWSVWLDYDVATANDYTMWTVPVHPLADRRRVRDRGGDRRSSAWPPTSTARSRTRPSSRRQTLTRATETLVPDRTSDRGGGRGHAAAGCRFVPVPAPGQPGRSVVPRGNGPRGGLRASATAYA